MYPNNDIIKVKLKFEEASMLEFKSSIFCFSFKHHVNVIGGYHDNGSDSGTYKTVFFKRLIDEYTNKHLICNKTLLFISNITDLNAISFSSDLCIICDEMNLSPKFLEDIYKKILESNGYLITIGRLLPKGVQFDIDAVYCLDSFNEPFTLNQVFQYGNLSNNPDVYVTEDDDIAAGLFSIMLSVHVQAAAGNGNVPRLCKRKQYPFIIVDSHKFGCILLQMLNYCKKLKNVNIFAPACLEELLVDSTDNDTCALVVDTVNNEKYFEQLLKKVCKKFNKKSFVTAIHCLMFNKSCDTCCFDLSKSSLIKALIAYNNGEEIDECYKHYFFSIDVNSVQDLLRAGDDAQERKSKLVNRLNKSDTKTTMSDAHRAISDESVTMSLF